jgi:hypothetical protein
MGQRPNQGLQRTALRARKIGAFLKPGNSPTAFSIYDYAAAEAQAVGPPPLQSIHFTRLHREQCAYVSARTLSGLLTGQSSRAPRAT